MHEGDGMQRLRVAGLPASEEQKKLLEQATLLLRYRMLLEKRLHLHRVALGEEAAVPPLLEPPAPSEKGL